MKKTMMEQINPRSAGVTVSNVVMNLANVAWSL